LSQGGGAVIGSVLTRSNVQSTGDDAASLYIYKSTASAKT
jgi:hypothetical protein